MTHDTTTIRAYFHLQHDQLWEFATAPIAARIAYIRAHKPVAEVPVRLRLLREITAEAFRPVLPAWQAYEAVRRPAWQAYEAVLATVDMEALHRHACPDCPWNGKTIFPRFPRKKTP